MGANDVVDYVQSEERWHAYLLPQRRTNLTYLQARFYSDGNTHGIIEAAIGMERGWFGGVV